MKKFNYYLKIWWMMSKNSFLTVLQQKLGFAIFLFGKLFRFGFLYLFLVFLLKGANTIAGYNEKQIIFFYLNFYFVDTLAQFFYREVYRFRPQVISGSFDLTLSKPFSALFRSLAGGADVIDLFFIPFILFALISVGVSLNPTPIQTFIYLIFLVNSFLIATAFHILVVSLGILTLEIDHTIMIYRDLTSLGRFPIEIYRQPLKFVVTYIIPIGVMYTFPAKFMMNMLNINGILIAFGLGLFLFFLSIRFWKYSLKFYTSASS